MSHVRDLAATACHGHDALAIDFAALWSFHVSCACRMLTV